LIQLFYWSKWNILSAADLSMNGDHLRRYFHYLLLSSLLQVNIKFCNHCVIFSVLYGSHCWSRCTFQYPISLAMLLIFNRLLEMHGWIMQCICKVSSIANDVAFWSVQHHWQWELWGAWKVLTVDANFNVGWNRIWEPQIFKIVDVSEHRSWKNKCDYTSYIFQIIFFIIVCSWLHV